MHQTPVVVQERPQLSDSGDEGQPVGGVGTDGAAVESPVGQRTRARNPLGGITLEELEAMLQDDDAGESDYGDDAAYQEFLRVRSFLGLWG